MTPAEAVSRLSTLGFSARAYGDHRVCIGGYGRDLSIWLELIPTTPHAAFIHVRSSWRSPHNGLRCKGAKHALLRDLHAADFITGAPPDDWRRVALDDPHPYALVG